MLQHTFKNGIVLHTPKNKPHFFEVPAGMNGKTFNSWRKKNENHIQLIIEHLMEVLTLELTYKEGNVSTIGLLNYTEIVNILRISEEITEIKYVIISPTGYRYKKQELQETEMSGTHEL